MNGSFIVYLCLMHLIQRRNRNWSWIIYYSFQENVAQLWRILKDVQITKRNSWEINCCWKIRQNQAMEQIVHVRFHFYSYFCNQKFTSLLSHNMSVSNVQKKKLSVRGFHFAQRTYSCNPTQHDFCGQFFLTKNLFRKLAVDDVLLMWRGCCKP